MRKDLRIGLAIGLVLLAVLVVYLLIPGGDATRQGKESASQTSGADDSAGTLDAESETTAPAEPPANDGAAPGTGDAPKPAEREPTDVFAGGNPQGGPEAGGGTPPPPPAGTSEGGTDWASLLNTPLRTSTPAGEEAPVVPTAPQRQQPQTSNGVGRGGSAASPAPAGEGRPPSARPNPTTTNGTITNGGVGTTTHTVQPRETFSSIAKTVYGSSRYYLAIQQANPNIDPDHLKLGMVINLPYRNEVIRAAGADGSDGAAERAIDAKSEYRVQSGDNLQRIAAKRYGTTQMWEKIYDLNRDRIGPDPARLKLNMVLKMPPADANAAAQPDPSAGQARPAAERTTAGR